MGVVLVGSEGLVGGHVGGRATGSFGEGGSWTIQGLFQFNEATVQFSIGEI